MKSWLRSSWLSINLMARFRFIVEIHYPQRMNPNDFGDSLPFPPVQSSTLWLYWRFWVSQVQTWKTHALHIKHEQRLNDWPPLSLEVLLLIALGEFRHSQVRVQPVYLWWLEVFEQEAIAVAVCYAGTHAATGQHHIHDILGQNQSYSNVSVVQQHIRKHHDHT